MNNIKIIKDVPKNKIGVLKEITLRNVPFAKDIKEIKTSYKGDLVKFDVVYNMAFGDITLDYDMLKLAVEGLNDGECCPNCGEFHNLEALQMYQLRMKDLDKDVRFQRCKECKKDWEMGDARFEEIYNACTK